jgi:virginiamycin A acetyltransferase
MNYVRDFSGPRHVKIGNDVWIGYAAVIINSVTIGDGAVIGAYAVVREDVPPYAIVIGNPARVIRYRFNETQIRMLLEIKWWDWPDKEILFRMPRRDDYEAFVEYNRTRSLLTSA